MPAHVRDPGLVGEVEGEGAPLAVGASDLEPTVQVRSDGPWVEGSS